MVNSAKSGYDKRIAPEFMSPFSLAYWKAAAAEVTNLRTVSICAVLLALRLVMKMFLRIPVGDNLNITLGFLANSVSGTICGPVLSLIAGAVNDILGCILAPQGGYMPIFTLIEMFTSFCFSICLYRTRITVWKLALSKILINLFGNIVFNSLALGILYEKGVWYYMGRSIVKNTLMLPIEIILLVFLFNAVTPVMEKFKLVPSPQTKMKVNVVRYIVVTVLLFAIVVLTAVYYGALKDCFTALINSIF